jgi:hypothetical protein
MFCRSQARWRNHAGSSHTWLRARVEQNIHHRVSRRQRSSRHTGIHSHKSSLALQGKATTTHFQPPIAQVTIQSLQLNRMEN